MFSTYASIGGAISPSLSALGSSGSGISSGSSGGGVGARSMLAAAVRGEGDTAGADEFDTAAGADENVGIAEELTRGEGATAGAGL